MTTQLEQAWELAKQRFAAVGIDVCLLYTSPSPRD